MNQPPTVSYISAKDLTMSECRHVVKALREAPEWPCRNYLVSLPCENPFSSIRAVEVTPVDYAVLADILLREAEAAFFRMRCGSPYLSEGASWAEHGEAAKAYSESNSYLRRRVADLEDELGRYRCSWNVRL